MSLSAQEILQILEKAKELGVQSAEVDGLKFQLSSIQPSKEIAPPVEQVEDFKPEEAMMPSDPWNDLTDEEILYWSCPHGAELEEQRLKRQALTAEQKRFEATEGEK